MSQAAPTPRSLKSRPGQPLIGIATGEDGDEVVHYFTSEEGADEALACDQDSIDRALSLAGAWQELDAEDDPDPLDELDQMRHASKPSTPRSCEAAASRHAATMVTADGDV